MDSSFPLTHAPRRVLEGVGDTARQVVVRQVEVRDGAIDQLAGYSSRQRVAEQPDVMQLSQVRPQRRQGASQRVGTHG